MNRLSNGTRNLVLVKASKLTRQGEQGPVVSYELIHLSRRSCSFLRQSLGIKARRFDPAGGKKIRAFVSLRNFLANNNAESVSSATKLN